MDACFLQLQAKKAQNKAVGPALLVGPFFSTCSNKRHQPMRLLEAVASAGMY
jgi:hypothetical protein